MLDKTKPYRVTAPGGQTKLLVMDAKDGLPAAFALMGTRAEKKVAIRITGGCKGMSGDDKEEMLQYFTEAFAGFKGLVWSGATRMIEGDLTDPMVTDVPGVIASHNSGCVALGTVPRTDMLTLQGDSRLVLDQYGNIPNPDMHGILIVQNGADGELGWDGDLDAYFSIMRNWQNYAGFTGLGLCSWNGGDVTREEIMRSLKLGWPTIVVRGSGRVSDEIANKVMNGGDEEFTALTKGNNLWLVDKDNSDTLRQALLNEGFVE